LSEPDLLCSTSDVRARSNRPREFIQTVIGAYQEGGATDDFRFTHSSLIRSLIDEFTVIENGREVLSLGADAARERYQKITRVFRRTLRALFQMASK